MESDSPNKKVSLDEKHGPGGLGDHFRGRQFSVDAEDHALVEGDQNALHRDLSGRHMQFIAIGGAIGSGLFIGSASAFTSGGPGSVVVGFFIIGVQVYFMMQQLAELAVMYPINGAFTMYVIRFVDPSWGFATAWIYALSWLTVLPFEISAACNIIHYWPGSEGITDAAWIVPILAALVIIQIFGVKGYGETEFVLSLMKVLACIGFIILGIIIDVGGVPTDNRGYIGGRYWTSPYHAFLNGFQGFCGVFVTAAFAYTGTELTGLAAAETKDPVKQIPRASTQVIWRIMIFYVVNLALVGLVVPATSSLLTDNSGASSRHSPFVIAIKLANIPALPSVFNAVILIAVISVANSCTFGSTRTIQALAANGMAPKALAYVDKKGRPLVVVVVQLLFGCLAFINLANNGGVIFNWLLALSGLSILFVYGSIGIAHIRFRMAWKAGGHSTDEIPYKATGGIYGSYLNILISVIALLAQFYVGLYPVGGPYLSANNWFQAYLAGPLFIALYLGWKGYSWFKRPEDRPIWIKIRDIDIYSGMREQQRESISGMNVPEDQRRASVQQLQEEKKKHGALDWIKTGVRNII